MDAFLAAFRERRAHVSVCPAFVAVVVRLRGVGRTSEFFEAEDHVLQGLHVRNLA